MNMKFLNYLCHDQYALVKTCWLLGLSVRNVGRLQSVPNAVVSQAWRIYFSRQFAVFLVFGGAAALVNLAVGSALYDHIFARTLPYWVSVLIGASCGLVINFGLNYVFNFKFRGRSAWAQFRTFSVVAIIGTILTAVLASIFLRGITALEITALTQRYGISDRLFAHVCAVGIVTLYSYAAHKYFSFNVGIRPYFRSMFRGK